MDYELSHKRLRIFLKRTDKNGVLRSELIFDYIMTINKIFNMISHHKFGKKYGQYKIVILYDTCSKRIKN